MTAAAASRALASESAEHAPSGTRHLWPSSVYWQQMLESHPVADLFPLMNGTAFEELVADVAAHGVRGPIILHERKILEGRSRYRAALAAHVECPTREYDGDDPVGLVVSANLRRRHLSENQRSMIAERLANLPRGANQHVQICAPTQADAAELLSVGRRNIQYARAVLKADRAVADLVVVGSINLHQARKLIKLPDDARKVAVEAVCRGTDVRSAVREAKRAEYNARIAATKPKPLQGKYRIIYADPPLKYYGLNQVDEHGHAEAHYDCLDDKQLMEFKPDGKHTVKELAEDNAVLLMWVPVPLLQRAFAIVEAWGFRYKSLFVWDKVRHNMGFYNSVRAELLLICTRGSCTPDTGKLIDSVQTIERSSKHSEKPHEFYDIIDAMYDHGRKLELFARGHREDWDCAGNESKDAQPANDNVPKVPEGKRGSESAGPEVCRRF
jgi:N6-adenosine-specific RNA methylase IME4